MSIPGTKTIAWFSCGAASAVMANCVVKNPLRGPVEIVYCNTLNSEHPDNQRFLNDCEKWFGQRVNIISSDDFESVDDVFEKTRYMSGVFGARCTTEMKKMPRLKFAQPWDLHLFGFTRDEKGRIRDFEKRNPDMRLNWPLRDLGFSKKDCFEILGDAGIRLPEMYLMGYRNNNCLGCVKSSSPGYWSKIRKDFPEVFQRRCEQSRKIGVRLIEIRHHERIFLDELPLLNPDGKEWPYKGENISCGPECASK